MCKQIVFDEDGYREIRVYCYSEKEPVGIGFGSSGDLGDNLFITYEDFDVDTLQESFWENYNDFEDGIEKAKEIMTCNRQLTVRQALFEIFGHFRVVVQINEVEIEPGISFTDEIEEIVYSMLELVFE